MNWLHKTMLGVLLVLCSAAVSPAIGQTRSTDSGVITSADIQRLQDSIYDAGADLARLRTYDVNRSSDLQNQLDEDKEARELAVKMERERRVSERAALYAKHGRATD